MKIAKTGLALAFLIPVSSAHAGLYHTLVENPLVAAPAVGLTIVFILLVAGLEHLRKKRENGRS